MNAAQLPNVIPLLPELVLGVGAMALLLVGVYRPAAATTRFIDGAAIALLALAGVILALLPPGKLVTFGGSFIVDEFARFLKILGAARLGGRDRHVDRLCQTRGARAF